ncbi:DODA-type extradiol aromatic ring-opening family dioxygenase [Sphingobium chungangianum]
MKQPSLYIPHGGGPCFFMDPADPDRPYSDPMWQTMQDYLTQLVESLPERPSAMLIVSAHWEEPVLTVHKGDRPGLLFDYYNFPPHTYSLKWDAPGAPAVADRAAQLLRDAGFPVAEEHGRGWDHGIFIPMKVARPQADIPVVQLSLRKDLDPQAHIATGRALEPLRDEGVVIIGSGMSFHNMRVQDSQARTPSLLWHEALTDAVTDTDPQRRSARIAAWETLPEARFAHPREEHLLPLMVALGAGGDDVAQVDYDDAVRGWPVSAYRFG